MENPISPPLLVHPVVGSESAPGSHKLRQEGLRLFRVVRSSLSSGTLLRPPAKLDGFCKQDTPDGGIKGWLAEVPAQRILKIICSVLKVADIYQ